MSAQKMLNDLLAVYSQREIGEKLGVHQTTISKIIAGKIKTLKFDQGLALLAMHKKYLAKEKAK